MKILRLLAVVVVVLAGGVAIALAATRPEPLPVGTETAKRIEAGPFEVAVSELTWIDDTRATDANGDYGGAEHRSFAVALWAPRDAPGPHPLIVYSHGFMSTRHGGTYLGEHLASHGYVVVSADYPLTNFTAPGGPNANDVAHQPADVSFLIDRALALGPDERTFRGGIDREAIGVIGTSLGGLTSTLAAYHPRLSDPRIRAAVSIAGPTVIFDDAFFSATEIPFLMIGGTHDAMVRFEENAAPIPDRIASGGLVTIRGGSHAGFSHLTAGPLRLLGNPDNIGCRALMQNIEVEPGENPFPVLGGVKDGIIAQPESTVPCTFRFEEAMPAGRQQWLTTAAARAFFESHFAEDADERAMHSQFLAETLAREIEEVHFTPAGGAS